MHGRGRVWATKFELGRDPFLKNVFWLPWQGKCPKTYAILPCIHVFHFSSPFSFMLGLLGEAGVFFLCLSFHVFGCWLHFFPWIGGRFCSARDWVVFLTFWELLVHFSIHVFVVSCVFTMAVKGHSRFWLSHRLLVSRTDYWGVFPLLWVVLIHKLQDCVFFPMLWVVFAVTFGDCCRWVEVIFPWFKL